VFEIVETARGYASTPIALVSFGVGGYPHSTLIADANSNLFGTTVGDQANSFGTVFEIAGSGFVAHKFAGMPGKATVTAKVSRHSPSGMEGSIMPRQRWGPTA
jgi:hypothetical protein